MSSDGHTSFEAVKKQITLNFKEAIINNNFDEFKKNTQAYLSFGNENDIRNLTEVTIRQVLLDLLKSKTDMAVLDRVLQLSVDIAENELGHGNLPVLVISDMFDGSTLSECEEIFDFVEKRAEIFKKDVFFKTCKNHLLRSCNDLLRRLSRSENTVFCGRILLFLARIFPLSERSGLNIISEFNLDNTTLYSTKDDVYADWASEKDEPVEEGEISSKIHIADYNMYRKFWSLQEFFRNPNTCYNKMHWRHFTNYTSEILKIFGSFKSDDSLKYKQADASSSSSSDEGFTYFAKYLTSPKLLELELSDSNFRRNVLLQCLVLFQYLSLPVKFKLESYVLTDEQQTWIKEATVKIYKLLDETPPNGPLFSKTIAKILKREEYWNAWKNEGCPDFKTSDVNIENKPIRTRKRLLEGANGNKILVGNSELTKLWNICPDNWAACKMPRRNFVPSLEKFFENAIMQADPQNQIEERYKDVNNPVFAWKALRLLSAKSHHFFSTPLNNVIYKDVPEFIEVVITKLPKEVDSEDQGMSTSADDQETPAVTEETIEDGNGETLHTSEEDSREEAEKAKKSAVVKSSQVEAISSVSQVQSSWKALASSLDFKDDEIEYFDDTYPSVEEKIEKMLMVWMEQDPLGGSMSLFKCALRNVGLLAHVERILSS